MEMIYSGIGVLLFAGYAMYDFQMIKKYPEDRYIDAAMHLYLDIFNLFIFILRLLMSQKN
jgi:FtsH-binding integral membrane protein